MGSPTCVACGAPAPPPPVSLEGMPLADIAPPMGFTNCSQCGKQLTVSTTSCPKCGAEFEEEYEEEPKEELKDEKEFEVEEGLEEDLMIEEPFEKEIEEKKKIDIKRTYSVIGDNIKYGVKVINKYNYTINNINIRINYPKDALDLMKPENGMLHISYINPGDTQSGNFFMKPLYCVKTKLSGVIDYLDPKGNFQVEKIKPLKTNLICPFIQPKKISEGEYVSFTKGMHSTSKGFSVKKGISLQFILNMCMNHCNYLYHVKKQDNKNEDGEIVSIIMYLSGESKVQELNYLLTIIINKNPSINGADIAFSAYCSSKEGLAGFIKEVIETLKYTILAEKDAHEVVMISNKQVINIIDSVVMRSKIGDNRVISSI